MYSNITLHCRFFNSLSISDYSFVPHSSKMMATGCLYDAIFALGPKFIELRRKLPDFMEEFIDINRVSELPDTIVNVDRDISSNGCRSILDKPVVSTFA